MTIEIKPLSTENRAFSSPHVVGEATCPICGQTDVLVMNDQGHRGHEYFDGHYPEHDSIPCAGSQKMLSDLK